MQDPVKQLRWSFNIIHLLTILAKISILDI